MTTPTLEPIAQSQLDTLRSAHPAAAALLSETGRRLFYPRGITAQAAEASGCAINATIGQITDGHGRAMALPCMERERGSLSAEELVLYAPQGGVKALRTAWRDRLAAHGGRLSQPVVTAGITHGLSTVSQLFAGPGRTVLLPEPHWGNYGHIFRRHGGATLQTWRLIDGQRLDLSALRAAVAGLQAPTTLVLNVPSNPVGYTPTPAELQAVVEIVAETPQPLAVICDDAYLGMVWEPESATTSAFHALSQLDPERVLAVKLDGATKELFFFGGRVGFITFGCEGAAAAVLEDKAIAVGRATVSSVPAGSQAIVLRTLQDPDHTAQQSTLRDSIRERYRALRDGLAAHGVQTWPFNSGFFVLLPVDGDPHDARRALLDAGVGVVAVESVGALRVSYASVALEDMPRLVEQLARFARRTR